MDFTNLPPDSKAFLAPMAGVADRAFREICRDFGAAYTVTEMVSVVSSTGSVPNRLSCRDTTGPATAMPTEKAASTRPAAV